VSATVSAAKTASAPILVQSSAVTAPDLSEAMACSIDNPECEACQ
jgi:ribonucleoside-diphosphate reductase alpha chain